LKVITTGLPGVIIIEPRAHGDDRGFFMESWRSSAGVDIGLPDSFVQSNLSYSAGKVLRGLHYQYPEPQGKLVSVLQGRVFDVAVDIRPDSPTFRQWAGVELSAENHRQLYVPEGYAHGFCGLDEPALMHYLCTREYRAEYDAVIAWDDPDIAVRWPIQPDSLSAKDRCAPRLLDVPPDDLPRFGK
jgi:dTDP-4-dehydrorhamnose 3,5-epimerase